MLQVWDDTAPGPVLPAKRPLACTYSYADDTNVGVRRNGHLAAQSLAAQHCCSGAKQRSSQSSKPWALALTYAERMLSVGTQ